MHFSKKLMSYVTLGALAISSLGLTTPSFAGDRHHDHGGHTGHHHYPHPAPAPRHYHHHDDRIWIGLGIGAAVGAIAASAVNHGDYYYGPHYYHGPYYSNNCRQVVIRQRCHEDYWGDYRCHQVRYVRYTC